MNTMLIYFFTYILKELSTRNMILQNKWLTRHSTFKLCDIDGKRYCALISPFRGVPLNNSGQIKELKD
jgi:hypothetical protein